MKKEDISIGVIIIVVCLLVAFLALIIVGQKEIGYSGLLQMMLGLSGILTLLYLYNRRYK